MLTLILVVVAVVFLALLAYVFRNGVPGPRRPNALGVIPDEEATARLEAQYQQELRDRERE